MASTRYSRRRKTHTAVLHDSWGFAGHRMFRWLFKKHGLKFYIIIMCGLTVIGIAGAGAVKYLGSRTIAGIQYCSRDPMDELLKCETGACREKAVFEFRRHAETCFPSSVANFT